MTGGSNFDYVYDDYGDLVEYDGAGYGDSVEILSHEFALANRKLAKLPKEISESPSLFLNGDTLLICGGAGDGGNNSNKCLKHENNSWIEHSTLNKSRIYASAVTTAEGTYIFGGLSSDTQDTFEFLPKNSNVWKVGSTKIPDGLESGCAVEVPGKRKILLIGGIRTEKRILIFNIDDETFEVMKIPTKRKKGFDSHTCARLPDTNLIVIAGGYGNSWDNGDIVTQDFTEILNTEDNTIMQGNPLNYARHSHGMAEITIANEQRLAVFGGTDEYVFRLKGKRKRRASDDTDNGFPLETLNPRTRQWEISDLKLNNYGFGYVSLSKDFVTRFAVFSEQEEED